MTVQGPAAEATAVTRPRAPYVLATLGVVGLVLRLAWLREEPFDFFAERQLYDALMARGFWAELGGSPPAGTAAAVAQGRTQVIEPPVIQALAAGLYRLTGGEHLALARAVLALVWVIGVVPLWRLARALVGSTGAWAAAVVWLFSPFAVAVSRSFQPDGLMLVLVVATALALVREEADPTPRRRWVAVLWGAAALLVKIHAVFVVGCLFVALALRRGGGRELVARRTLTDVVVVGAPALAYLVAGAVTGATDTTTGGRIHLDLLVRPDVWGHWWLTSGTVAGPTGLVVVAVALVVGRGAARAVLAAVTAGYVAGGVVFPYHYATHSYHQLTLVLAVALALAVLVAALTRAWAGQGPLAPRPLALALLVATWAALVPLTPSSAQPFRGADPQWRHDVAAAREIGRLLGHSPDAVLLGQDYGFVLGYYGYLAGPTWPTLNEVAKERLDGLPALSPADRLARLADSDGPLRWFVVADLASYDGEPGLAAYLEATYPVAGRGDGWIVYDLDPAPG